jgi:hypothetical protein
VGLRLFHVFRGAVYKDRDAPAAGLPPNYIVSGEDWGST